MTEEPVALGEGAGRGCPPPAMGSGGNTPKKFLIFFMQYPAFWWYCFGDKCFAFTGEILAQQVNIPVDCINILLTTIQWAILPLQGCKPTISK